MSMRAIGICLLLGSAALAEEAKGKVVWESRIPSLGNGTAAVADGWIYASVLNGSSFVAIDAHTGKVKWQTSLQDTSPYPPILDEDSAYVITGSCTLYRLARSDGKVLWSRWLSPSIHSMPALSHGRVYAAATQRQDRTERGSWHLVCLDAKTGDELWAEPLGADILGAPMVGQEHVFVSLQNGELAAVEMGAGKTSWKKQVSARSMPVRYRDQLVFHVDRGMSMVDVRAGKESWTYTPDAGAAQGGQSTAFPFPMISGDRAYMVMSGTELHCVDMAKRGPAWKFSVNGHTLGAPVMVGGRVYFGASSGRFRSLDAATGTELWSVKTGGAVLDAPSIMDGRIYVYEVGKGIGCLDAGTPTATGFGMWGGCPEHTGAKEPLEPPVVVTPSAADPK
ncbi:MAG: PQQ-binding-like beta-propeller repeat protein [Planctomycetes bacterium]|nr:PQQ-binding-like beta-propeller repeat protein [Planctomycetota bacterium]